MKRSLPTLFSRLAFFNFAVLSLWGVLLRYIQFAGLPFNYQFLLHAHSHFAFSGWMFLLIALLIGRLCGSGELSRAFRQVLWLAQICAWGMLLSFSLQGYRPVSIFFSTLFVLAGFRLAFLVWKGKGLATLHPAARWLINCALAYLGVSALGPFALGPLAVFGLKASPLYQDAIYFYLHCQLNGFMELAVFGLLASSLPTLEKGAQGWLKVFTFSVAPLYLIFCLWSGPVSIVWWLAATGAGLHLLSWLMLARHFRGCWPRLSWLEKLALVALTLKCLLQLAICVPLIGGWAFSNRNLIIGYVHLLTLGIVMPVLLGQLLRIGLLPKGEHIRKLLAAFALLVIIYLALLFLQPMLALQGIIMPHYQFALFLLSVLFLGWGLRLCLLSYGKN